MRLFNLVKQNHAVRLAPYFFRQLPGVVIAHIAGRRADDTRDRKLLHILAHIQADQGVRGVKHIGGQLLNQLRLAYAGGTHKNKGLGPLARTDLYATSAHGCGNLFDGFILADDMGFQRRLQTGQFLNIPLLDFCSRDPCPHGDGAGNIRLQYLIVLSLFLQSRQLFVNGHHFGFQFGDQLIVDLLVLLCGFRQIFNILLQIPFFAFQDLRLADSRVAQIGAGATFIQQVNGFIRQVTVCYIPLAHQHRFINQGVGNLHLVVLLVVALNAQQHFVGVLHRWLLDLHRLEPALQGGILLYKLTILGKGGSADHLNFAARERRLQDICRVHGALTVAGAHQIVHLVNEQNNIALGLHLVHQTLDPALKLATELGAGHQCGQVQQIDLFVCQARRHLPFSNANG